MSDDDSKEFRTMFAKIPKNSRGYADEENVYKAFMYIIGIDLLTPERFQAAKQKRFGDTKEFNYEDCAELFLDIDYFLEHIPFELPKKSNRFIDPIKKAFRRICGLKEKPVTPSFIEELPPDIPRPQTPPLPSHVDT